MGPDRHLHRTCLAYVNQMFQQISGVSQNFIILDQHPCIRSHKTRLQDVFTYPDFMSGFESSSTSDGNADTESS